MTNNTTTATDIRKELYEHCDFIVQRLLEVVDSDDPYEAFMDIYEDVLDVEYRFGSDRRYRSVRLCVAWGGPNIYIDTKSRYVEGYWGVASAEAYIPDRVVYFLDDYFENDFNC